MPAAARFPVAALDSLPEDTRSRLLEPRQDAGFMFKRFPGLVQVPRP
jgi:hypothetical protein